MTGRGLLLLRHGRTGYNAGGIFQGRLDPPLDAVGFDQAEAAAEALADLKPTVLLSSSAQRARATAEVVARRCGLELGLDERLLEIDNGSWAGLSANEVAERYPEQFAAWQRGDDIRIGGGESYRDVGERAVAATARPLAELESDGLLVVVTHGGVVRALAARTLGLPHEHWRAIGGIGNCAWTLLAERQHRWVLQGHGITS